MFARGIGARAAAALCVMVGLLVAVPARSEEPARPWAAGVAAEDQARAQSLFDAGNALLDQNLFAPALELYRQALARWDHPAIRYNVAVALINLERPIEAYENLSAARRYGDDALEPDVARQARSYERLLEGQLVRFAVDCVQAEVTVRLDGRDFLTCPGEREVLLLPGEHQVTAARPGFLTRTLPLVLTGGEARRLRIELMTLEQATVERRRWNAWKPWAVIGGGLAVGVAGLGFELQSRATYQSYDDAIAVLCAQRPCTDDELPDVVTDAHDRARLQNRVGIGLLVTGGAALTAGIVLAILNRPVRERVGYDGPPSLAPMVTAEQFGMAATWSF